MVILIHEALATGRENAEQSNISYNSLEPKLSNDFFKKMIASPCSLYNML